MVAIAGDPLTRLRRRHSTFIHFTFLVILFSLGQVRAGAASKQSGRAARVQTGLDVLESLKFAPLRGKHVGLITNHTGLDSQGRSTVDIYPMPGRSTDRSIQPEHGLAGRNDEKISSAKDPATGLPVHSLYGETLRPTDEMLKGMTCWSFDVQDAGVRFYTYTTTMLIA